MASRLRQAVAPAYLFLCLILGGSAQGIWGTMLLQLIGIAIIAWSAADGEGEPLSPAARRLLTIAMLGLAVVAIQLIPLPASLWSNLPGRAAITAGYAVLGLPAPALPLSLTPYASLSAYLAFIPPLATICAIVRLKAYRPAWLVLSLVGGTLAGIMLGAVQVATGTSAGSPWYFYEESSIGVATGFFANANHMASLLVITLPFLAALLAAARGSNVQRYSALLAILGGVFLVIAVGLVLNRSLAGYGLALPVLAASALIVISPRSKLRRWSMILAGISLVGAVGALGASSIRTTSFSQEAAGSVESRQAILTTTLSAARDFMPLGSGLGSFPQVYPLYEDHDRITTIYMNHAHNDYAELALETGVPGLAVLIVFLLWWGGAVARVWRSVEAGPYARAASIASAAILVHSLVDFPLRTVAISACFGMCLALLADRRAPPVGDKSDLRPARHIVLR
jgi:O-antigen ligase